MYFPNQFVTQQVTYEVPLEPTLIKRIIQIVVDIICIIIVFVAYILVLTIGRARIRFYTCDMSELSFPNKADTIPFWAVGLYSVITPILAILLIELGNARIYPYQNHDVGGGLRQFAITALHAILLFVFGIGIILLLTEIGKIWVGAFRPYFMTVCAPNIANINCITNAATGSVYNSIDTGGSFCTGDANAIEEARKAWPSGHASFSFYAMMFLIIYLQARLFLLRFRFVKGLLQVTAFIAAYVTSLTRLSDYKHTGYQVFWGAFLGTLVAGFITLLLGRVLWDYERDKPYYDFDLKPEKTPLLAAT